MRFQLSRIFKFVDFDAIFMKLKLCLEEDDFKVSLTLKLFLLLHWFYEEAVFMVKISIKDV